MALSAFGHALIELREATLKTLGHQALYGAGTWGHSVMRAFPCFIKRLSNENLLIIRRSKSAGSIAKDVCMAIKQEVLRQAGLLRL